MSTPKPKHDPCARPVITDNTGGRPLNPERVGKLVAFMFADEILRRVEARKTARGAA